MKPSLLSFPKRQNLIILKEIYKSAAIFEGWGKAWQEDRKGKKETLVLIP